MDNRSLFYRWFTSFFIAVYFFLPYFCGANESSLELWYNQPAKAWTEALPIGNGSLGAMVFGGVDEERLQLNQDTIWGGGPYNPVNPEALDYLPKARSLIFEGKYKEAENVLSKHVMGTPVHQMPYQTVGNLRLKFSDLDKVTHYRRELDLNRAVASVTYEQNGINFKREIFSSYPDQVIVMHLSSDSSGSITFSAEMDTSMEAQIQATGENMLLMLGKGSKASGVEGAIRYVARVKVLSQGGRVFADGKSIHVKNADEATVLIAVATNYNRFDDLSADPLLLTENVFNHIKSKDYKSLYNNHISDYQTLFNRVKIDLGNSDSVDLPTDIRIKEFSKGKDPQLAALYYQFARYLLISSSRKGSQPANLQGIWNDSKSPPWQSKYTININTEMNYWISETGNLSECVDPLISMVEDLAKTGSVTAKKMYGARGWVVHHNTDLWRASAPIDGPFWGMWSTGGAWLCLHLWDRYLFSQDRRVLKRIYPIMKSSCEFFLDTLQKDPSTGYLVTNPSVSPENAHPMGTSVCAGPTMDMQILRDLFANTYKAATLLGVDEAFKEQINNARNRLAPNKIGKAGQLQEWLEDWDMQAPNMHHRHVSHLYGLFPGRDISTAATLDLANAVKKSLELRGDKSTGWATSWRICLWAHLLDGNHAYGILKLLLSPDRTYPDMFDAHPPFQIDGNFGGAAGICEMLLQSSEDTINLLPALPDAWPTGRVRGLMARGGFEVSLSWKDGALVSAEIKALTNGATTISYHGKSKYVVLKKGEVYRW